ncbi:MAG TPA: sarcosine oxidase subunit gamma family protein, partial [Thermopolyspora sp.]
ELPFLAMCEVRGPVVPSPDSGRALDLGPDWWLIVEGDAPGVHAGAAVDVSAQRTVLELAGPGARDVLLTGCPIDLHPSVFEVGSHARTLLAQAQVIVVHAAPDTYQIFVWSSFAGYLAEWLLDALTGPRAGMATAL